MLEKIPLGKLQLTQLRPGRFNIGVRLLALIGVQGFVLIGAGVIAMLLLVNANKVQSLFNDNVVQKAKLVRLSDALRHDVLDQVHALNLGKITWRDARNSVQRGEEQFYRSWEDYLSGLSAPDQELVNDAVAPFVEDLRLFFDELTPIIESESRSRLELFASNDLFALTDPFLNAIIATTSLDQLESQQELAAINATNRWYFYLTSAALVGGILLAAFLGFATYYSITNPVHHVAETVARVSEGDYEARSRLDGSDEIATLGNALDTMLDERVASLAKAEAENEKLNNAVLNLLQAVYKLSQRDLTVRLEVTEDVTGPVADSLNLLTNETARVLHGVLDISQGVAEASNRVKSQSDSVIAVATEELKEVEQTASQLAAASEQMLRIAKLAHACNEAADQALKSTETAQGTVLDTVSGITTIRDTIRETEKRIKRLGERSQEISGVVNLINSIAERTHILALNASMHAASAGEAGRGFAVVADEVQRLAENARNATSEIASLVNNIQVETADTVSTMNEAITQVVQGTQLAERAGTNMDETQKSTAKLVAMVQQIAKSSREQARSSNELRNRAEEIEKSTRGTNQQLLEQTQYTDQLVEFSEKLLKAVSVFALPQRNEDTLGRHLDDTSTITHIEKDGPVAVNA
ncbi:MAG: HAMP domain-containing protein [Gammaproteobacteria bacterium]|nr:HAMP domain-containing protein [Gammaproteobacteria bacterium]NIR85936.1 HAMP domain-containing protein [Gammaproteobacteria bacterium]NIR91928.1 HAMP domain-containing protein [Gammaproteobacteria bacterium]NIU07185.1 HAMP domain-containing protein [Gammaproteobacteria bacterium]NIV53998.1 HAMP domain-containing protein [Gammaproteobacteria bacterium]